MSEVKVNKISPRSGTTVTLGDSGDTFTIPSGATINNQGTATNFGATGSASWVTTVKTGDFTAVAGEGYFVNTTSGEIDVALPAGTAGAVVAVKDYLNTFDTNNCLLVPNGSDKIGGLAESAILSTEGIAVTLIFIDSTRGWLVTDSGLQSEAPGTQFVSASGGTVLTCGNFKTHVFTGPGTFTVCNAGNTAGSNTLDYVVVAGGGGSGSYNGGGGGAGGFRLSNSVGCVPAPTMSPLVAPTGLTATPGSFPITVGAGGAAGGPPGSPPYPGESGVNSTFSTITSAGGGGSGHSSTSGQNGGAGGGAGGEGPGSNNGGTGNTPPTTPAQGEPGGDGGTGPSGRASGGGGGAAAQGEDVRSGDPADGGDGGIGSFVADAFFGPTAPSYGTPGPTGLTRYFAGGGGGGVESAPSIPGGLGSNGTGGAGGGGQAGPGTTTRGNGTAGTTNTGGGAGGASRYDCNGSYGTGATGGSGIVIIRYKFQ
jgi:hypothetical protein